MPTAVFKDRVRETSSTAGLGSITLDGPFTGFQGFSVAGDGAKVPYLIEQGTQWELGWGTYHLDAVSTLDRDTVVASSSGAGIKVDWGAGTKQVRLSPPADSFVNRTGDNTLLGANTFQGITTLTQPLRAASGTPATPSISFSADTDTGLYRITTNAVGISCGGTLALALDPTGIDTSLPFAALRFISDVPVGTAPVTATSTTLCPNLNADLLDGQQGSFYLSASNMSAGTLAVARGGTGLGTTPANGQLLIGNGVNYSLGTITGTANRITVTNGAGSIGLNLPQDIATTSSVQFTRLGLGVASDLLYSLKTAGDVFLGGETHCFGDVTISKSDPICTLHDPQFSIYLTLYTFNDKAFLGTATDHDLSLVRGTTTDIYATLSATTWDFKKKVLVHTAGGFGPTNPHIAGIEDPNTGLYWLGSDELWISAGGNRVADFRAASIQVHTNILSIVNPGTAPMTCLSSTVCGGLNADMCDGQHLGTVADVQFNSLTLGNTGLHLLDTNASHDLILKPGSDLTLDRTLTLTTGDADRTITLNGNPTLADWFDQSVKTTATPQFAGLGISTDSVGGAGELLNVAGKVYSSGSASEYGLARRDTNTNSWTIYSPDATLVFHKQGGVGDVVTIDGSGNLGVGTTPAVRLHVLDTSKTATTPITNVITSFRSNASGADVAIQLSDNVANTSYFGMVGGQFYVAPNAVEIARFTTTGVGIASTNPTQARLVIMPSGGSPSLFLGQGGGEGGEMTLDDATNAYHIDVAGGQLRVMRHAGNNGGFQAHGFNMNASGNFCLSTSAGGAGAVNNLVLGGAGTVLGPATAGIVHMAPVDNGGVRELRVQPSSGGPHAFGSNLLRVAGGTNGQSTNIKHLTENVVFPGSTNFKDSTIQIPAKSLVFAVSARVTSANFGFGWNVGISTDTARYISGMGDVNGATDPGTRDSIRYYAAATAIRVSTSDASNAVTGTSLRITIHYIEITPPTS